MNEIDKLKVLVYDLITISERKQKELIDMQKQIHDLNAQIIALSKKDDNNQKGKK